LAPGFDYFLCLLAVVTWGLMAWFQNWDDMTDQIDLQQSPTAKGVLANPLRRSGAIFVHHRDNDYFPTVGTLKKLKIQGQMYV